MNEAIPRLLKDWLHGRAMKITRPEWKQAERRLMQEHSEAGGRWTVEQVELALRGVGVDRERAGNVRRNLDDVANHGNGQ